MKASGFSSKARRIFKPAGYIAEVLIGLDGKTTLALVSAENPVLGPLQANAILDSGCKVTCVAAPLLQQLGLVPTQSATTQTAAGPQTVNLFAVSPSVHG